jgi:GLPGLI family protein
MKIALQITGSIIIASFLLPSITFAQKTISEGSLVYEIAVQTGSNEPKMADMFDGATTTMYFKGTQSRSELVSGLGSEVNIYDSRTGTGVILKDYSGQKLMITLTKGDWEKKNKKYEGITFETTAEKKVIAGYNAVKAIAKLKDGTTFTVYYTTELNVANKDYEYQFKTLPGLALQYEWQSGKMKFTYTVSKISLDPVPLSKFEIPKSGYRIMTFEEQQKLRSASGASQ